jgi:hypothetical protein
MTNKQYLKSARLLAKLMDNQFNFLGIKFGLDNILGIVPGGGDAIAMVISLYLVYAGYQMKIPIDKLWLMVLNLAFDTIIGSVPILGDLADIAFKANVRNLKILEDYEYHEVVESEVFDEPESKPSLQG